MQSIDSRSTDLLSSRKRTRRNAIKPNSSDSDLLRQFSLQYHMGAIRLAPNTPDERVDSITDVPSEASSPHSPEQFSSKRARRKFFGDRVEGDNDIISDCPETNISEVVDSNQVEPVKYDAFSSKPLTESYSDGTSEVNTPPRQ